MASSDFHQIAASSGSSRAERLFRASVSAFCSLTRPSRREIAQLEDLTLPLFDLVSVESRRFVAAALSECKHAPAGLVRRLADQSVDIAAPLLIRSEVLTDIDLIALIGRHGLPHARAIARRTTLHPTIAKLIAALDAKQRRAHSDNEVIMDEKAHSMEPALETSALPPAQDVPASAGDPGAALEGARRRLRAIMLEADAESFSLDPFGREKAYRRLRDTALTGNPAFFQTALADTFSLDMTTARSILQPSSYAPLMMALRALELDEEKALLIVSAAYGSQFGHAEAIRLFLMRYRLLEQDAAMERVRGWKAQSLPAIDSSDVPQHAANGGGAARRLRAS
jgi:uncharacterized protein (DUF2336 family)